VGQWVEFFEAESERKDEVLVLVGTKKDLVEGDLEPAADKDEIKQLVEKYRFTFKFETSAKANLNIDMVFEELSRNLIYNSLQRKKTVNPIREEEWSGILKRDKEHLMREEDRGGNCC
jgi:predicted GTPase